MSLPITMTTLMPIEPFMIRALLAGILLGPLCAFLGVFATARRMAFFSDTISHGALAGIALGLWIGFANPTVSLVLVSLLVAGIMLWLKENTELLNDTIMALLLSGSVAIGIIILSLLQSRPGDIHRYLFGDILAIGWSEVWQAFGLFTLAGAGLMFSLREMTLITANEDLAHVCGVRLRNYNFFFVLVLTLTVAITIRLLGVVLVTALLVIPPAAARNLSNNLRQHLILSACAGFLGSLGGVILSYCVNVPCGPAIVVTCIALFIVSLVLGRIRIAGQARPVAP
ncbi:MAG TPA: metal ABC transporter permease [Candidatus Saccharimonadales bacterium]|nr:metal ABC transporter permease [Candidatus Saccharimonadales bacterium]